MTAPLSRNAVAGPQEQSRRTLSAGWSDPADLGGMFCSEIVSLAKLPSRLHFGRA
jgi:hypothetical protein